MTPETPPLNPETEPLQAAADPARTPASNGNRNVTVLVIVVLAVTFMLMVGRHLARKPAGFEQNALSGELKGKTAPDFELKTLDGKTMKLSDLRGKAVLLNFWATWCGPCKIEMPWFAELQNQYGPQGLQIIGVALDDTPPDEIKKFAGEMGVNYPILLGKDSVGDAYAVQGLPTTFYIDRTGHIVGKSFGLIGKGEIEENIKAALRPPAAAEAAAK